MLQKLVQTLILILIHVSAMAAAAYNNNADEKISDPNVVRIANSSQCAADSQAPTNSAFIHVDTTNIGRIAFQLAQQKGFDIDPFVARTMAAYKTRLANLTEIVLEKVVSGQWPLIDAKNPELVDTIKSCNGNLNCESLKAQFLSILKQSPVNTANTNSHSQCLQVQELSTLQSQLFYQGVNKATLTAMAKGYQLIKSQQTCSGFIKPNQDPSLLLQLDVLNPQAAFSSSGFDIWNSFKTYLSLAWRNLELPTDEVAFRKIFLSLSLEENLILFSNGCKSISRPACTSDFLTSYQIRRMMISIKDSDPLNINSEEMRKRLFKPDTEQATFQQRFISQLDNNQWASQFFKSLSSISWGMTAEIKKTTQFFQALKNKKTVDQVTADLLSLLDQKGDDPSTLENFHYLCGEADLISQPQLSFYSFDLQNLEKFAKLSSVSSSSPIQISEIMNFYKELSEKIKPVCARAHQLNQKAKYDSTKYSNYRPWFKRSFQQFAMYQALVDNEDSGTTTQKAPVNVSQSYLQLPSIIPELPTLVFCTDAIDCTRTVFESMAQLNRIALNSRALLQNDIVSPGVFNQNADKVTCGLYNPWETQDLAKKKLFSDLMASAVFGWTSLPIYLDTNYRPGQLVSFKKLIEDGSIKFDAAYDKPKAERALAIQFGALFGVPCSLQISQLDSGRLNNDLPTYLFKGISIKACQGSASGGLDMTGASSLGQSYKQSTPAKTSVCGSCSINFEEVLQTSWKQFVPFRFFIRILDSVAKFNNSKDDPSIPHADLVNLSYLNETYKQYGEIPDHCVETLRRGLQCRQNLCESLAVRDIESMTHKKVKTIQLESSSKNSNLENSYFNRAWVTIEGCSQQFPVSLSCSQDASFYFMSARQNTVPTKCGAPL